MTIDEAIEFDESMRAEARRLGHPNRVKALSLSIESLKAIKSWRVTSGNKKWFWLPGETEE